MKPLKDTIQKGHDAIADKMRPKVNRLGVKYRVAARIRMANAWGTRHPKKMFLYVVGSLVAIMIANAALSIYLYEDKEQNQKEMTSIATVEPMFNALQKIQKEKEVQRERVIDITENGHRLRYELDSLMALPVKSRKDSLAIVRKYRQMEIIVNSLKNNTK